MNNKNLTFPNNITFAKKTFWNILYISAIFSIGSLSAAETVILKNGTVFKGQVLDQNKEGVKVKTEDGRSIEISKFQILKIIYREVSSEQMKSIKAAEEKRLKDLERLAQEKEKAGEAKRHEIESEIAKAEEEKNKQEEEERIAFLKSKGIDTGPKTRFGAILRSVILPGWGQFYQGRNVAGVGFFGTFLAGAGYAAYQQQEYLARVNDYHYANEKFNYNYFFQKTTNLVDQQAQANAHENLDHARNRSQIAFAVLAGIYAINLIDVVVFHPKQNFSLRASGVSDGLALRLEYRF